MKKYYSPTKDYYRRKRLRPCHRLLRLCVKSRFRSDEVIWLTEKPTEPAFFVSNHTKIHAPLDWILSKELASYARLWTNCYFLTYKDCWRHMMKVLIDRPALKPLVVPLLPLIIWAFRGLEPIPVYHDTRVMITINKSVETLEEGKHMVVFPERTECPSNNYIWEFNRGFPSVAQAYYRRTGKCLAFYPMYCCPALGKYLVGKPIHYDPNISMFKQRETICRYLEDTLYEMASSLPPHKQEIYG